MTAWLLECRTIFHHLNPRVGASQYRMACWGDWLGCSLEHGWEGFGDVAFMWGQGQRVLQRPLSSVGSPFCYRLQLSPALSPTQWLSWLGPGREGRRARGHSWRHPWTLLDPCLESEREQNRGSLEVSHDSSAALSASSVLWIPSKPQLLLHAKGCASPSIASLTVRILVLFLPQISCLGMSSYTGIVSQGDCFTDHPHDSTCP